MSPVAAIILAAGRGTRFGGSPKLLADLDGKPLVRHVAQAALAAQVGAVIVVTGHERAAVARALEGLEFQLAHNPDYADGLSTSLRRGFATLSERAEAAAILLGDMPRIGSSLIDELVAAWSARNGPSALIPTYEGRRGNPVVLSHRLAPEVARLTGDAGAGAILRDRPDVVEWPVATAAILQDVDTPQALAELRRDPSKA